MSEYAPRTCQFRPISYLSSAPPSPDPLHPSDLENSNHSSFGLSLELRSTPLGFLGFSAPQTAGEFGNYLVPG